MLLLKYDQYIEFKIFFPCILALLYYILILYIYIHIYFLFFLSNDLKKGIQAFPFVIFNIANTLFCFDRVSVGIKKNK